MLIFVCYCFLLFSDTIKWSPNNLFALYACQTLQDKGIVFQLNFLGGLEGNDYAEQLQAEISVSDFSDRIHLRGHVSNVTDYLEKTDIFLFPSAGEGMPNAFIEAMHYNNVCIAYDNTVFPEFLEMGFYIHLVKNGDVDALTNKLLEVALNLADEKCMSLKNAALVQECFQPERELAQWNDILV